MRRMTTVPGMVEAVKSILPELSFDKYKGQAGRIGIVGGSKEYTGAPFFAAISVLKLGGDLAHVFCANEAAVVIKSYSPELIVHPILDSENAVNEVSEWLPRLHSLIIGPGLGRNASILNNVKGIIEKARQLNIPIVVDADGLWLLTEQPNTIKDYQNAILTPNVVEFTRLYNSVIGKIPDGIEAEESVINLSKALGDVTVMRKGPCDIIASGNQGVICSSEGSPRRCGGQGDLLSGSMGLFLHWSTMADQHGINEPILKKYGPTTCAAYAASLLTRECNRLAFLKYGRSMTTTDMVAEIRSAMLNLFDESHHSRM